MAKHCDVCNNSYPETEDRCPHCGAAARGRDEVVDLTAPAAESDSSVDLGEPVVVDLASSGSVVKGEPAGGGSDVAWSALVEDADAAPAPPPAVASDSAVGGEPFVAEVASGVDLPSATPETPPPTRGRAAADAGAGGEPFLAEVASDVDLTGGRPAGRPRGDEPDSGVFVAEAADEETSAIDLGALARQRAQDSDVVDAEVADSSSTHPGAEPILAEEGAPDLESLATEPDMGSHAGGGRPAAARDDEADTQFLDDVAAVEAGSAVNLGEAARPTERPSSRDLIAEAVESGVDLAGPRPAEEGVTEADAVVAEAGDSAVDLGAAAVAEIPSSGPEAVQERKAPPGSHHEVDLAGAEAAAERVELGADEDEVTEVVPGGTAPGSSGVDLGGRAARGPKKSAGGSSSNLDLEDAAGAALAGADSGAIAAEDEDEAVDAAAVADEEEEDELPRRRKRPAAALEEEDEEAAAAAALAGDDEEPAAAEAEKDEEEDEDAVPAKAGTEGEEDEDEAPAARKGRAVAEEEEEDEDKPAPKPPKARSGAGCLALASVLGLLIGAGGAFGLWLFGIEPPAGWKLAETKPATSTGPGTGTNPRAGAGGNTSPVADAGEHLKHGEFTKAVEGLKDAAQTPEVQAQRGTARWMQYLQEQMKNNAPLKADDQAVKDARADLEAAKDDPEALLTLGNLQEYTVGPAEALKTYQQGLQKFADKPWAKAFQAQIDRLESSAAPAAVGNKPAGATGADGRRPAADRQVAAQALVALLVAFQADAPVPPAADQKSGDEAGYDFWAAAKLARAGQYLKAAERLEVARKAHDKLRFSRLGQAQNPYSDRTEKIFLQCAEEIEAYWKLRDYLSQQPGIAKGDPQKAVEALVKQKNDAVREMRDVALKLGVTPDQVMTALDDRAKTLANVQKDLKTTKAAEETVRKEAKNLTDTLALTADQLKNAQTKLKAVGDRLTAAGIKDDDFAKGVGTLAAERAAAAADRAATDKALDGVVTRLAKAKVAVAKKDVLLGMDRVVEKALTQDPNDLNGELRASREKVGRLGADLLQRHTPEEMLDVWLPVLADRTQKDAVAKAVVDANRAGPTTKKALAVLGLADRNLGNLEQARSQLSKALAGPAGKGDWQAPAAQALKELSDPNAYYLPRAKELYEWGKYQEALDVLAEGLKLFPKEKDAAVLLPLRSLVSLELARKDGKLDAKDGHVAEARKDAQAAAATGSAEGHYALGRINEELGNLAEAKASYAKALAAHAADDEAGARYRLALARVLKLQAIKPAGGRAAAASPRALPVGDARRPSLMTLLVLLEVGMQPGAGPEQDEASKLLDEVIRAKDGPDTFMLKAQAQALRGLWTPALKTYVTGLRPHIRRDYADGLADLVAQHPALRRPSAMDPPNPLLAEASYASGLRHYFARRFADAESAFARAAEYDNQDARYFYFLGLSRLALNKTTDADADFREGAQLELLNRPGREAVSTALERIQGPARQTVNRFRP